MNYDDVAVQALLVSSAVVMFSLMLFGSMKIFLVRNASARKARFFVGCLAVPGSLWTVYCLWSTPPSSAAQAAVATVLFLYGAIVFVSAAAANRANPLDFVFSSASPAHIVRTGPYRYLRHPFYSSYCAAWLAAAVGAWRIDLALLAAVLVSFYVAAALCEERDFGRSSVASDYDRYRGQTWMLVPRLSTRQS